MSHDATGPSVVRSEFATTDPEVAEEFLSASFVEQRLQIVGRREEFTAVASALSAPGLTISRLRTGVGLRHSVEEMADDALVVPLPTAGHIRYLDNDYRDLHLGPGDPVLSPPTGRTRVVSDDVDVTVATLDRRRVAEHAAAMSGLDPDALVFHDIVPTTPGLRRHWAATVRHVRDDVLANCWATRRPILIDQAFRLLAAALLSAFPNSALARRTDPDASAVGEVSTATLRRATDYLLDLAAEPIGPADVAEHVGAPYRDIVEGLRRRGRSHPAELLWRARLRGAHRDLRGVEATGAVDDHHVDRVAARWGFAHPARFRIAYAALVGEDPEETLGR